MYGTYLEHSGTKHKSGRYKFGSGDRPYQHEPGRNKKSLFGKKNDLSNSPAYAKLKEQKSGKIESQKKLSEMSDDELKNLVTRLNNESLAGQRLSDIERNNAAMVIDLENEALTRSARKAYKNVNNLSTNQIKALNDRFSEVDRMLTYSDKEKEALRKKVENWYKNYKTAVGGYNLFAATVNSLNEFKKGGKKVLPKINLK